MTFIFLTLIILISFFYDSYGQGNWTVIENGSSSVLKERFVTVTASNFVYQNFQQRKILLFGIINTDSGLWSRDCFILPIDRSSGPDFTKIDQLAENATGVTVPYFGPGATTLWNPNDELFYFFGGPKRDSMDGPIRYDSDIWKFDIEKKVWSKISSIGWVPPNNREYHSAVLDEPSNRIFIFGGRHWDNGNEQLLNDLWIYDIGRNKWSHTVQDGDVPSPRWGQFAAILNNQLYIFGGRDTSEPYNDLYAISLTGSTWEKKNYGNDSEIFPRYNVVGFTINSNFILFGGIDNPTYQVYKSDSNDFDTYTPNGSIQPSTVNVSGIISSQGIYILNEKEWLLYQDGKCGDGTLTFYEECSDLTKTPTNLCSYCYIDLCGNDVRDKREDCDGGNYCTANCLCPDTFYPDPDNGCYPDTSQSAFYLMIVFPLIIVVLMIIVIINYFRITPLDNIKEALKILKFSKE